jgi:toxin ParE1/3/4
LKPKLQVVLLAQAESDLRNILKSVSVRSGAGPADLLLVALRSKCASLSVTAMALRLRPELGQGLRAVQHKSYLIIFEVVDETVRVLRIIHASRDLLAVLERP